MKEPTLEAANAAKAFTAAWLAKGDVDVAACHYDSFGRALATATRHGENLASALIKAGLGVAR